MLAAGLLLVSGLAAGTGFPAQPAHAQVVVGARIARASPNLSFSDLIRSPQPRSDLGRIWKSDRKPVGWWSNGYEKVSVEYVTWLSPDLIARWLGYLEAREYWPEGELQERWESVSLAIGGRRVFIVELSAFPKMPTYEIGDYKRPTTEEIDDVRFVYTAGGRATPMPAVRISAQQSRRRSELDGFAWWQLLDFGADVTSEFEPDIPLVPLPLGDYYRSWFLVSVEDSGDERFEVRVLSRRKERVARFVAPKRIVVREMPDRILKIKKREKGPTPERPDRKMRRVMFGVPTL